MNLRNLMKKTLAVITSAALIATVPMTAMAEDTPSNLDQLEDILSESTEDLSKGGTLTVYLEEGGKAVLSDALETDMSWLDSVSIGLSALTEDESGLKAGAFAFELNDAEFLSGSFKVDPDTTTLYLQVPDLREEALSIGANIQAEDSTGDVTSLLNGLNIDFHTFYSQALDLFSSIDSEEFSALTNSVIDAVFSHLGFDSKEDVTVDINGTEATVSKTIFSFDEENFQGALTDLIAAISNDALVQKVLTSDLADSIAKLISEDAEPGALNDYAQGLLSLGSSAIESAGLPGFSAYIESDESGSTNGAGLDMIQGGEEKGIIEVLSLSEGDSFNIAINLGEVLKGLFGLTPDLRTGLAITGTMDGSSFIGVTSVYLEDTDLLDLDCGDDFMQLYVLGELYATFKTSDECSAVFTDFETDTAIPATFNTEDNSLNIDEWASGINVDVLLERLFNAMGIPTEEDDAA